MLLLCEYALRTEQYSLVFFLCGCVYSALRLLGLDVSRAPIYPESPTEFLHQEAENMVVWACYTIDVFGSSGVDKNSSWRGDIPPVPLPCANQDFLSQTPPSSVHFLSTVEDMGLLSVKSLDLPALVTILIRLRANVSR